jgi:hypothetical protein
MTLQRKIEKWLKSKFKRLLCDECSCQEAKSSTDTVRREGENMKAKIRLPANPNIARRSTSRPSTPLG